MPPWTRPAAPANLAGTSGNAQALLSWDANTELDFASYTLSRRLTGEADFAAIASGLAEASYTDLGLVNDQSYDYEVNAVGPHRQHLGGLERLLRHPHSHHGALAGQ